jgi:hypothetical protein
MKLMMKQEFENMIGKEVSYETFEMYEKMYMALPESVTKQQFVGMLNIEAIPESEEAVARRAQRKAFVEEINRQIGEIQESIKCYKKWADQARESMKYWRKDEDKFMYNSYRTEMHYHLEQIRILKNRIAELKMIIE